MLTSTGILSTMSRRVAGIKLDTSVKRNYHDSAAAGVAITTLQSQTTIQHCIIGKFCRALTVVAINSTHLIAWSLSSIQDSRTSRRLTHSHRGLLELQHLHSSGTDGCARTNTASSESLQWEIRHHCK